MKAYIAYYRVSTKRQEESGLGLESQRQQVALYATGKGNIISSFTDVESGKNSERPELAKAFQMARKLGATIIIAKLDRLSRSVAFIAKLMEGNVDFVCCDMPEANTFTLHIFSALAQQERELISLRTKEALARKKAQGYRLGSPQNLTPEARRKALQAKKNNAWNNVSNKQAYALVALYRKELQLTYQQIADKLNELGYKTRRGKAFLKSSVRQLEKMMEKKEFL